MTIPVSAVTGTFLFLSFMLSSTVLTPFILLLPVFKPIRSLLLSVLSEFPVSGIMLLLFLEISELLLLPELELLLLLLKISELLLLPEPEPLLPLRVLELLILLFPELELLFLLPELELLLVFRLLLFNSLSAT